MKLKLSLLMLTSLVLAIHHSKATEFETIFSNSVSSHFSTGMDSYNAMLTALSNQLVNYDPNNVQSMLKPIDSALLQSSRQFVVQMRIASGNAKRIVNKIDQEMVDTTNEVSQTQAQTSATSKQIRETTITITGMETQVNTATQAVIQAQNNLNTANAALKDAQDRLDKAQHNCLSKRRRKRGWLDSVTHVIDHTAHEVGKQVEHEGKQVGHVVDQTAHQVGKQAERDGKNAYSAACQVIDVITGEIERAKRDIVNAKNDLNRAAAHRDQVQAKLNAIKAQLAQQRTALQQQQTSLTTLNSTLATLKTKRDKLDTMDAKIKSTLSYIDSMLGKGVVAKFNVDVGYLLNADSIAEPLQEIGSAMASLSGEHADAHFLPAVPTAEIRAIKQKLDAIAANANAMQCSDC